MGIRVYCIHNLYCVQTCRAVRENLCVFYYLMLMMTLCCSISSHMGKIFVKIRYIFVLYSPTAFDIQYPSALDKFTGNILYFLLLSNFKLVVHRIGDNQRIVSGLHCKLCGYLPYVECSVYLYLRLCLASQSPII